MKHNIFKVTKGAFFGLVLVNVKGTENIENKVKMNPKGESWEGMSWVHPVQNRRSWCAPVSTVMSFRVP